MMQPSKVRRHAPTKRRHYQQSITGRGMSLNVETIEFIPASCVLKPLRDQMIVQPIDVIHSHVLIVPPHQSKLIRGKVLAIGPGHYPNIYIDKNGNRNAPKGKRTKIGWGERFVPTEVKVGDIVNLDGRNTGKSAFDCFYYGDKFCLHAREADVAAVEDPDGA
jgi:hypothetical protein